MRKMLLAPALAGLLVLGACATATPYQAAGDGGRGYVEQQIETNRWTVGFSGNSLTDRKTVETYLLYRAAELTTQEGYQHFRVVKRDTEAESRFVPTGFSYSPYYSGFYCDYRFYGLYGRPYYHSHSRFHHRGFYDPFGYGFGRADYREIVRYEASAEIIMGSGPKPEEDAAYFDAEEVLINLSGQIQRPEV